jgi:hypothetical protein
VTRRPLLDLDPAAVAYLPLEAMPGLLAALAAVQAAVAARLVDQPPAARRAPPEPGPDRGDRWLTVAQLAERLGRNVRWVYRRAHSWDFTVKDGKSLLFSERGLAKWMERHQVRNGP